MQNKYEIHYNYKKLQRFYSSLKFTNFKHLNEDRHLFMDSLVDSNRLYFNLDTEDIAGLATSTAIKLLESPIKNKFLNGDELAYFFMRMVDPDFQFLEAYESVMNKNELINTCLANFRYYDNVLIKIERIYNDKYQLFAPEDLWCRESLKRTRRYDTKF